MFEAAVAQKVSKEDFDRVAGTLRVELLRLQDQLKSEDFSVVLLLAGSAIAGKDEAIALLNEWMDPRWVITQAYGPPSDEERERPEFWRYWRDLPPKGHIGLFAGSWYHQPIQDFVYGHADKAQFRAALDRIAAFERTLAESGTLIVKFWLYMDEAQQKKRIRAMEKDKHLAWRVGKQDWKHLKHNREFEKANQIAIERTDTDKARWMVINGADRRFRSLTILNAVRDAVREHIECRRALRNERKLILEKLAKVRAADLKQIEATTQDLEKKSKAAATAKKGARAKPARVTKGGAIRSLTVLDRLDMSRSLSDDAYNTQLLECRAELGVLCRRLHFEGKSAVLLFEGPDAAGKGGAIRRLASSMDARDYRIVPVAKPNDEEHARHYLWRFWRHLPRAGRMTIFDRSWYGRVLVERVEGFAQPEEWQRAYREINEFEEQMTASGIVVVKFWVHITKDEQYRRFKEREKNSFKAWKLTAEDWRNRAKWDDYGAAVHDMVERTSTVAAPWTLVEGNDKKYARIKIMTTLCAALRARLDPPARKHTKKKSK